jgi:hypothetical protein
MVTRDSNSLIISGSLWDVWTVEPMRQPWQQFVDDFWVHKAGGAVESTVVRWSLMGPYGTCGLSNPWVTFDSRSLKISESLGAVWAVEIMGHPWQQFIDYFWVPRSCLGYRIHRSPATAVRWWFLSPLGCLGCQIHASPVTAVRWCFMSP